MDDRLLDYDEVLQVCFVTDDLDRSLAWFGDLTGKAPVHVGDWATSDPETDIHDGGPGRFTYRLGLFRFGALDLEFLQPGPEPSTWRDELEARGPCFHHLGIRTRDMTRRAAHMEEKGLPLIQSGEFDGKNGRYAYFDGKTQMGAILELLEWDRDKEPQP